MSTRNSEYLEAINHLPDGAMLVFQQVTWNQYEKLLDDLEDHAGLRVSYDDGKLEIMSPLPEHEYYKDFILVAVHLFAQEHDIELETFGSATWKRRKLRKGAEPDTCFYVANARAVIGKRKIDLETDPPPDVVVEIDTTSQSLSKFSIYAALGVPEIWRYDGERITMYELVGQSYVEGDRSRFFPNLSVEVLAQSLEVSKTQGQTAALAEFRQIDQRRRINTESGVISTFEVRDPVHGFVSLDAWEWDIINQPAFQRLRRIKQLAWTDYIYPGAAHSRFEHSLGVMHVASRLYKGICDRNQDLLASEFSVNTDGIGRQAKVMRLAALLHDVGHAPFSHAAEELFPIDPATGVHFEHEQYSAAIVEHELRDVIENHALNRNYHITVEEIRNVFSEKPTTGKNLVWKLLVSGQMDADRMDYLLRDSLHAGVTYGRYDLDRIAATVTLCEDPETGNHVIGIEDGGVHAVEGLLIARFMMFTQIYFHKTRTIYDYHLVEALKEILKATGGTFPKPDTAADIRKFIEWDDWKVLGAIKDSKAGQHGEILFNRKHFRRVFETREVPDTAELETFERIYSGLTEFGAVQREAEKSWYKFKKEGIRVRSESATAASVELSTISPVVRGLLSVRQRRIYVPHENRAKANQKLEKLK